MPKNGEVRIDMLDCEKGRADKEKGVAHWVGVTPQSLSAEKAKLKR